MAGRIFSYAMPTLSCSKWDLAPFLAIESSSPALGAQSLSHQGSPRTTIFNMKYPYRVHTDGWEKYKNPKWGESLLFAYITLFSYYLSCLLSRCYVFSTWGMWQTGEDGHHPVVGLGFKPGAWLCRHGLDEYVVYINMCIYIHIYLQLKYLWRQLQTLKMLMR